jgi:N-acetylglucosamine-6-phosphate deacetylase
VAPELPGALEFIEKVKDRVRVSVAHTTCDYDQAMAAFQAGAKQVTHLFNAMNGFAHRQPGVVGAAADSDCMVELICDGVHIHPSVVRAVFKLFGADRVILISDSLRAAGMPDGQYTLGGQDVTVRGPRATLADGTLAGSVSDLMQCMKTAVSFGVPLRDAVKAAAWNPARALGIDSWAGSLEPGKAANLAVLNGDLSLRCVLQRGRPVAGSLI